MESYLYVLGILALTVYGQIIIKSRILHYATSLTADDYTSFLLSMFFDPWIISVFVSTVVAAAFWMLALRNADLSLLSRHGAHLCARAFVCFVIFRGEGQYGANPRSSHDRGWSEPCDNGSLAGQKQDL